MTLTSFARTCLAALAPAALVLLAGCAGMHGSSGGVTVAGPGASVSVAFSDRDRQLMRDYYAGRRSKPLPPGLARRDRLPPGLERQLRKDGQLPPGLQSRALPRELESRLSPLPAGYARVAIGADIVLQNTGTRVVVDIVKDIALD